MTQTVEELERLADEAIQRGQFDVAIRHSRELTKISPDTAQGWFLSGRASRLHGDLNSASAFLEKAVNLESSDTQSLYELAYCYFARGDSTNSLELLERLESLETADPSPLGRVATLYNQLGEHSKSLVLFEKVVVQEPETARFHFGLAETLRFHGDFDKAEKEYNAAIRCDSHCYEAYLERANVGTWTQASNHTQQIEALLEWREWLAECVPNAALQNFSTPLPKNTEPPRVFHRSVSLSHAASHDLSISLLYIFQSHVLGHYRSSITPVNYPLPLSEHRDI